MTKKQQRSLLLSLALLIVLGFSYLFPETKSLSERETVTLIRVVDGDTVNVDSSYGRVNLRLSGVNTPEVHHPTKGLEFFGKEASDFTTERLLQGQEIEVEWDQTQQPSYNRPIGIVFIDGVNLNLLLVEEGYADLIYLKEDMPYAKDYQKALKEAMAEGRGRWQ